MDAIWMDERMNGFSLNFQHKSDIVQGIFCNILAVSNPLDKGIFYSFIYFLLLLLSFLLFVVCLLLFLGGALGGGVFV